jgi:glyoxylase-like metal-dependent hydrolase (beta-lactamase superfamily II)
MQMILTPGHTHDSIVVYIREDKVLLAADTVMALPYFVWGDRKEFIASLRNLLELNLECVVQGHGEVLLRGEIRDSITTSIRYLNMVHQKVAEVVESGHGLDALRNVDVESCGKSRIPLNGLIQDLHSANVEALYKQMVEAN